MIAGYGYEDAGGYWTDEVDGEGNLTAVGSVNSDLPGVYQLTFDYTDAAGNAGEGM